MRIDEKQISYDFVSLLTHNPEYFDIKVEKTNNLKSKIHNHLDFLHAPYKNTGFTPYHMIGFKERNLF